MRDVVKTIDILQGMLSELDGERFIAMRDALDAVMQVRAFEEAESGRWVDVEIKPTEANWYLTQLRSGMMAVSWWSEEGEDWVAFNDVIAWQTLPKPYSCAKSRGFENERRSDDR